jgi:hypothetical protein
VPRLLGRSRTSDDVCLNPQERWIADNDQAA